MGKRILIVGSGPAALIAADILSARGHLPLVFERRTGPGWKLLVAGSSGLNVSYDCPEEELFTFYYHRQLELKTCLAEFGRADWLQHLHGLGQETFLGTSRRYFLKEKKASGLLAAWTARLKERGVSFFFGEELKGLERDEESLKVRFASGREVRADAVLLALGSPSWEQEAPSWPGMLSGLGVSVAPFAPANAGYELGLPAEFFKLAEGKPIKGITLTTTRGAKTGECMITRYGLEGTPVYSVGCPGTAIADLKPDLSLEKLNQKLAAAPARARLKTAKLSEGAELLLKAIAPPAALHDPETLAAAIKALPLPLTKPRPLTESISASGGLEWAELTEDLEIRKIPGVFCAGEMVDWDAPTGGFLIQASVSMGVKAARAMAQLLARKSP